MPSKPASTIPCATPQAHCRRCSPMYQHLMATGKFHEKDLLIRPHWYSIALKRVFPASERIKLPNPLKLDILAFLNTIFPLASQPQHRPRVYEAQILHIPGKKNFEVKILIDIPPKWMAGRPYGLAPSKTSVSGQPPDDTLRLIGDLLFCLTPGSPLEWHVETPTAGECMSRLRLEFFTKLVPFLDFGVRYRLRGEYVNK